MTLSKQMLGYAHIFIFMRKGSTEENTRSNTELSASVHRVYQPGRLNPQREAKTVFCCFICGCKPGAGRARDGREAGSHGGRCELVLAP